MTEAECEGTLFKGADMRQTIARSLFLRDANLTDVKAAGADFRSTKLDGVTGADTLDFGGANAPDMAYRRTPSIPVSKHISNLLRLGRLTVADVGTSASCGDTPTDVLV